MVQSPPWKIDSRFSVSRTFLGREINRLITRHVTAEQAVEKGVTTESKPGGDTLIGNTGATFRAPIGFENQRIGDPGRNSQRVLGKSESW